MAAKENYFAYNSSVHQTDEIHDMAYLKIKVQTRKWSSDAIHLSPSKHDYDKWHNVACQK